MSRRPIVNGLLICDQVIIQERTRNVTPVNCWTSRAMPSFPSEADPFVVLAFLSDGQGEIALEMVIHALDNWDIIHRMEMVAELKDPMREYRCSLRLRNVSFPYAGHYQVSIMADGAILAQRKFTLTEK